MPDRSKRPPGEALVDLRRRLALLSARDPARTEVVARAAEAYGVSIWTIYCRFGLASAFSGLVLH